MFDLNGTLTDDLGYHIQAYYETINNAGIKVGKEEIKKVLGKPCEKITKIFAERYGKKLSVAKLCRKKKRLFLELTRGKEEKVLIKDADFVLKELSRRGILLGLFTGSSRENILLSKELMDLFNAIVAGTEVRKVKPNPKGLLKIMKKLEVNAEECVYVGDLVIDMKTAKNAGMQAIGFENACSREELINGGADIIIEELKGLLNVLEGLR